MFFSDRTDAGERLAGQLANYRGRNPLILAVPRGGVVVAFPVWQALGGELDLVITRKIGAPHQPELAVGAVTGDGKIILNEGLIRQAGISREYIDRIAAAEQAEITRRLHRYRGDRPVPRAGGKTVIVVDDGIATGYTLMAALRGLQESKPAELVLAVPVGPPDTLDRLRPEVDRLICIEAPVSFAAVGQFYRDFGQTGDAEVKRILQQAWDLRGEM